MDVKLNQLRALRESLKELTADIPPEILTQDKAAGMPELAAQIRKQANAAGVGDRIASAWYGYGLGPTSTDAQGNYHISLKADPKTFDDAMKYLWYKVTPTQDPKTRIYQLGGSPYPVRVTINGNQLDLVVMATQ